MHIGTMRNTLSTCAQYGIVGVPVPIFCFINLLNKKKYESAIMNGAARRVK
jgi:hypothetical protein